MDREGVVLASPVPCVNQRARDRQLLGAGMGECASWWRPTLGSRRHLTASSGAPGSLGLFYPGRGSGSRSGCGPTDSSRQIRSRRQRCRVRRIHRPPACRSVWRLTGSIHAAAVCEGHTDARPAVVDCAAGKLSSIARGSRWVLQSHVCRQSFRIVG